MKNYINSTVLIVTLISIQNSFSQCPNTLENQATGPNAIIISSPELVAGADSIIGINDNGECGLTVTNNDNNQPWSRIRISINLAENSLQAGDELNTSIEVAQSNGQPRVEYNMDNAANEALIYESFTNSNIHNQTITVPSGISSIDIWLYSNYTENTPGSNTYKNLSISKVVNGGETPSSESSVWSENNNIASYFGKVGVGTTSPGDYDLAVNGEIRAKEIKVETANWPDYVFAEYYTLPTLKEVQNHIDQKGHLINIPSAKEIEENGLELGEMNRLLLEKIEELTLYTIKQQNEINLLKKQINKIVKK
ncbi:hypothetical protein SAMN04488009_2833 [Maribacter sedimenticola]|uniref:Uncharacterized protein n=1 Tax=Maribacter sedimenticola TaxID=228956 RepID=A0ABY1SK26_9FLAO|nr:hypothetical protein [Maribacter sedimenticola]SNR62879.1 hypothetical protein SAMN04488009_2833 [Maribacter sedimenticola]